MKDERLNETVIEDGQSDQVSNYFFITTTTKKYILFNWKKYFVHQQIYEPVFLLH